MNRRSFLISSAGAMAGLGSSITTVYAFDEILLQQLERGDDFRYFVEFRARPPHILSKTADGERTFTGHAFVLLGREYSDGLRVYYSASGFYPPSDGSSYRAIATGSVKSEIRYSLDDAAEPSETFSMYINKDEELAVHTTIKHWAKGDNYNLLNKNCVTMIYDVARALGLPGAEKDFGIVFPTDVIKRLREANASAGGGRKGPFSPNETSRIRLQREAEYRRDASRWQPRHGYHGSGTPGRDDGAPPVVIGPDSGAGGSSGGGGCTTPNCFRLELD